MSRRRHLMDFDDFDRGGIGDALSEVVTPEQLKGLLLSGLVGGGGILGIGALVNLLPVAVTPIWKSVIMTLSGLVGGRLLWPLDEDAGRGFAGGVSGHGIASLVKALVPSVNFSISGYDPKYGWGMGMGQPGTRYMDWGVGRTRVDPFRAGSPQLGRTRVESRQENEFMLGKLGQDVTADVGKWIS